MISVWSSGTDMPKFPSLEGDVKTGVLIIGGGMAGILTAYFLEKKGVPYLLAEKGRICGGVTGNTTAKITFQTGLVFDKILKRFGEEKAGMYLSANRAAFEKYAELCKNIDCDYEIKDNFVYSLNDPRKLEAELKALDKIGYRAEFRGSLPIPVKTVGAVCFPKQAQFDPLKFAAAVSVGLNIYENTFVRETGTSGGKSFAVTDKGRIYADKIIVTTHFPFINKHGSYFLKLYQSRSYVIALENAQDVSGMYVDESGTGMSFRNYGKYLLLGGGGHRTGKPGGDWEVLRAFARRHYPDARERYFWAAQDCMSLDNIPYIGRYSANTPDMYAASGFNKWGMVGSMVSAMILSDMAASRKNDFAEVFSPSRSILCPQLAVNGAEAVKNLLTFSAKRCPHMGCALKWNPDEHSWDCACHGSRFAKDGSVLDNPANGNLKR